MLPRRALMNDKIVSAQGENLSLVNVKGSKLNALSVYGKSTQSGTPSPDNPVPIVSAGDSGEIEAKVYGGNLISSDISSWNQNGWSGGTILQLSDGIKIKTINGWSKVYYDTSEMNGKTLNFSFDYQQIESETTSPSTSNAFSIVVQNENKYPTANSDIFPFQINSLETVKTHVSVSFTARNYLCFFLRVNTEGAEAGETRAIEVTNIMLNAGSTALAFEPYVTPQTLILSTPGGLPGIPVTSGGNYTDESGQQWIADVKDYGTGKYTQNIGQIASYNGEDVGDVWMSSTGQLTTGANVIYQLATPIVTDLPAEEIAAYKALHTYSPTTTVSNDAGAWMKVGYREYRR